MLIYIFIFGSRLCLVIICIIISTILLRLWHFYTLILTALIIIDVMRESRACSSFIIMCDTCVITSLIITVFIKIVMTAWEIVFFFLFIWIKWFCLYYLCVYAWSIDNSIIFAICKIRVSGIIINILLHNIFFTTILIINIFIISLLVINNLCANLQDIRIGHK